jgi:UDP-N-acetylglucosamine--N-acetylmuramyl-(pentapeptide) pyrophosphoryl-undecaprenol N-acetylglucosamine transferase
MVRAELGLGPGRIVLVVGGSQGSAPLNSALLAALSRVRQGDLAPLPADAQLLWSTGPAHYDDVSLQLERLGGQLPVRALPYVGEMEKALSVATLAVSRAGAIALAELCAWGVPAILVPLPHAAADHQRVNARSLAADGAAVLVEEADIRGNPEILWERITHLLAEPRLLSEMGAASRARGNPLAAADIATDIWQLMEDR